MKVLRGELFVDIAWVAVSAWYIGTSMKYPPAGRLIPLVVGIASLIVGAVQLVGNFVPMMQKFTHDRNIGQKQAAKADVLEQNSISQSETARQWIAMFWATGLVAGLFVLGFLAAIPLFFLAYFLLQKSQRNWKLAIFSAVVMGALTYGIFDQVLGLHLYNGLIFS